MNYKEILEGYGYEVKVENDYDVEQPTDELCQITYSSNRYVLGHKHVDPETFNMKDMIHEPVYAYIHSGVTISLTPFSCRWDSGQSGYIVADKAAIREEFGVKRITKKVREKVQKRFKWLVESYDAYLSGDFYWVCIEDENGDLIDSVGGIQGDEGVESFMRETLVGLLRDKVMHTRNTRVNPFMMPLRRKKLNKLRNAFHVNDVNDIKFYQMSDDDITMMIEILNPIKL